MAEHNLCEDLKKLNFFSVKQILTISLFIVRSIHCAFRGPQLQQRCLVRAEPTTIPHTHRCGWVVSVTPRPLYPGPTVYEAEWGPGPICTGAENFAPTGIQSPDRPNNSTRLNRILN